MLEKMQEIPLSVDEFDEFRDVQIRPRADWPATFSCSPRGEVWPFKSWGYTYGTGRLHLEGIFPLLDHIVEIVLRERKGGGRFLIDDDGVFVKPWLDYIQLVSFVVE